MSGPYVYLSYLKVCDTSSTAVSTNVIRCDSFIGAGGTTFQTATPFLPNSSQVWRGGLRVLLGYGGYTEDPAGGQIIFASPVGAGIAVRACYYALPGG